MRRAVTTPPALSGFDFVRLLGSGGFSDVFLYQQHLPRREVAVKVLLVDEVDAAARAQFVAEANAMAQLSTHPYIVTIYHAEIAAGTRPYLVMEYCPGPSLAERYKAGPVDVPDALRVGIRVGSAVAAAHAQGILHRDIKPANVLTNAFGWPALTDFGIASTFEGELSAPAASTGARDRQGAEPVGLSVPWSPPEMFHDDPQADVRSDVFSLAATIHTVLAGRTPFEAPGRGNGTLDLIARIERGAITPIDRSDVPRSLTGVLARAMSARPDDRYSSAVELVRALQRVELELGYAPTAIELPNLGAAELGRPKAGGGDATRMRPIATVAAQPTGPVEVQGRSAPGVPAAPEQPEATRVRDITAISPQHTDDPASDFASAAPATERVTRKVGKPTIIALAAVAAAVVAAVIIAIVFGTRNPADPAQQQGGRDAQGPHGPQVQTVPDPVAGQVTRSADGHSVTFAWANPEPAAGDSYSWRRESTDPDNIATSTPEAVVTGVTPGAVVCIDVVIVRGGRSSSNPLKECTG